MLTLPYELILASNSPRRKELLKSIVPNFSVQSKEIEEVYPKEIKATDVPEYLAKLKGMAVLKEAPNNALILAADTIVVLNNIIYGKPKNKNEAIKILKNLSGKKHEVITGVALLTHNSQRTFKVITQVYFNEITNSQIDYYIDHFQPYDKAGAYAIQEWIGKIGIEKIEGDYFNVVGLPVSTLYIHLKEMSTE